MSVTESQIQQWLSRSFPELAERSLVIRIVENAESETLNNTYRALDKPTNILSFPYEAMTEHDQSTHLGDLVIALSVLIDEAESNDKSLEDHLAHLLIHGVLHLLGYDHESKDEAGVMEKKEVELLEKLAIANPY